MYVSFKNLGISVHDLLLNEHAARHNDVLVVQYYQQVIIKLSPELWVRLFILRSKYNTFHAYQDIHRILGKTFKSCWSLKIKQRNKLCKIFFTVSDT